MWHTFHCRWIQTHRDGPVFRKLLYLTTAYIEFLCVIWFYTIVHVHLTAETSLKRKTGFITIARLLRKKVIIHFHPSGPQILDNPTNIIDLKSKFSKADLVLVLSPEWARLIKAKLTISDNVRVLYNPCPTVTRSVLRESYILFAGTLIPRKGYADLIRAFAMIAKDFPNWKVKFAGNGETDKAICLAKECGVDHQIDFLGWIEGDKKKEAFQHASIYCLASEGEGFPMGLLDAWAYGIPAVVTPVGGIPDIVKDGENGLVFPINDTEVLAQKLKQLIEDSRLRNNLVREADRYVDEVFNISHLSKKLSDLYQSLIERS
ncbi:glycosyltransferase family 4 protein [Alistipes sp.]|uniref:glycosyltransferase family 4 protein n=1 Tax=Alistipes sp. TaxID=1872444 RepID=UPI003AF130A3